MAYRIMVHVGVFDLINLFGWFVMSVSMILNAELSFIFAKIIGTTSHTGWQTMVLFSFVLAVNRSEAIIKFMPFIYNKDRFWKVRSSV